LQKRRVVSRLEANDHPSISMRTTGTMRRSFVLLAGWLTASAATGLPVSGATGAVAQVAPASRGSSHELRFRHYPVSGTTAEALWRAVQANGPRQTAGTFAAYTDVHQHWSYEFLATEAGCGISEARVRTTVEIHLPQWVEGRRGADPALVRRWDDFLQALRTHEAGHQRLAEEEGRAIRRAILAVRTGTCAEIDGAVAEAAAAARRAFAERSRRYDAETEHGRTQGAYWSW
jgi:predicted secreted Zn-dependent protease